MQFKQCLSSSLGVSQEELADMCSLSNGQNWKDKHKPMIAIKQNRTSLLNTGNHAPDQLLLGERSKVFGGQGFSGADEVHADDSSHFPPHRESAGGAHKRFGAEAAPGSCTSAPPYNTEERARHLKCQNLFFVHDGQLRKFRGHTFSNP